MGEVVCGFTVKQCLDFVKNIQQQANDVAEIQALMTTNKYFIFTNALKRIRNALIMLSNVFTSNNNVDNENNDNMNQFNMSISELFNRFRNRNEIINLINERQNRSNDLSNINTHLEFYRSMTCEELNYLGW